MRFSLRDVMLAALIAPPAIAGLWWSILARDDPPSTVIVFAMLAFLAAIARLSDTPAGPGYYFD